MRSVAPAPTEIDADRWRRLKDHLADLAELDAAARVTALNALDLDDEDRAWLHELAAQVDPDDARLQPLARTDALASAPMLRWQAGDHVGAYAIDGFLGRGGMGEVYAGHTLADGQPVALKILRPGLEQEGYGHFSRNEQRALKRLDDPRIARFIDAFAAPGMGVCLVLEQIHGQPVDAWCAARNLSTRARLRLFVQICEAVASAHAQLVVHRDLKPGNVLITSDGEIKLLDFGIAKLLDEDGSNTQTHGGLYTLEFAAPEQVLRQPVSVATDIYALGVMLYRLLTGASPYATAVSESLIKAVLTDPPRSLAGAQPAAAAGALAFDHDLDRVIARAMEKEPRDRYRSVMELAADVQAIHDGAPIRGGGGRWYRLVKFVRRHPSAVAMSAVSALAMLGATVVSLHWANIADANAHAAAIESQRALAVSDFLIGLFQDSDPGINRGDQLTANQILERGATQLELKLADQPLQRARLQLVTGDVYIAMGEYGRARNVLERALAALRAHGGTPLETAHALRALAHVANRQSDLTEALEHVAEAETLLDHAEDDSMSERTQLALIRCRASSDLGRLDDATAALQSARAYALRIAPANPELDAAVHAAAGDLADETGDFVRARSEYEAAVADYRAALGDDHYRTVAVKTNLGALLVTKFADLDAAQPLLEDALAQWKTLRGERSAAYASTANTLGELFRHRGDHARASVLFEDSERAYRAALGDSHPSITWPITNHAKSLLDQGRYPQALAEFERALVIVQLGMPETRMRVTQIHKLMVTVLIPMQRYAEALDRCAQVLEVYRAELPVDHPEIVNTLYLLGLARFATADRDGAKSAWDEAQERAQRAFAHAPAALEELRAEIAEPDKVLREYAERALK